MTLDEIHAIVAQCSASGIAFDVKADTMSNGERPYLQVAR